MLKPISFLIVVFFSLNVYCQNYVGFSKGYIKNEMKSQRKELKGPFEKIEAKTNYVSYVAKDGNRVIYYHFVEKPVQLKDGTSSTEEMCYKYVTVNKCKSNINCPELEKVINSLNSHFTKVGELVWHDEDKTVPQEWVIMDNGDHFEVHVRELE